MSSIIVRSGVDHPKKLAEDTLKRVYQQPAKASEIERLELAPEKRIPC
jgi:hypothetical protein